jgi:hypothetical protein
MKRVLIPIFILISAFAVCAQGVVDFNNNRTFATATNESRLVFNADGFTPLVGTNFVAQLWRRCL